MATETTLAREPYVQAHVKGIALLQTLEFAEHKFGPGTKQRLLAALPPSRRLTLGELILPIQWYDMASFVDLLNALDRELGAGDGSLIFERGYWDAGQIMNGTLRLLLKMLSPEWLLEKGTRIWNSFQDSGRWEVVKREHGAVTATLRDLGMVDAAICANTRGWISGLLALCRCKQISVVEKECRARGGAADVFEINWT
jgi:predicted hydrocarbon binding protein